MANGIDQEIQAKVDAYRGNPQALQQRYAQNQQLVDLLALQKLKSEKEAAAREMQMQMQQQPQTIKQQREAELLGMTKQEMMQQTQGILQQRQAEQQKNMQQVAQGGIGALAGQRPPASQPTPQGQPMPQMAGGGIVSFQEGGSTTPFGRWLANQLEQGRENTHIQSLRASVRNKYRPRSGPLGFFQRQTEEERARAQEIIRNINTYSAAELEMLLADDMSDIGRPPGVPADYQPGTIAQIAPEGAPLGYSGSYKPLPAGAEFAPEDRGFRPRDSGNLTGNELLLDEGIAGLGMGPSQRLGPRGGIATEDDAAAETAGAVEGATTPSGIASLDEYVAKTGIGGGDADAAMQRGFQAADAYTGRAEKAGRYADMEAELRALDAEMYDPEQDRRDQLKAFLAGTANTTNFGSTMAGGTLASLNLRRTQQAERRQRLRDIFDMAERGMTLDTTLAEGGLRLGQQMYADAMANQRTALQAAASMRNEDVRAATARAELEYQKLRDDEQFELDRRELNIEEAYNAAQVALATEENATRRFTAVTTALRYVQDEELAVHEFVVENSQLPALQSQLEFTYDPEERARIDAEIAVVEQQVAYEAESLFDKMNGVEARDALAASLLEFTGTGATMLSMEDVAGITREE